MEAPTDICKQQRELEEDYDKRSEDESMADALLDTPSDEELGGPKPPPPPLIGNPVSGATGLNSKLGSGSGNSLREAAAKTRKGLHLHCY